MARADVCGHTYYSDGVTMKKLEPIETLPNGKVIIHLDADFANADWLASRRLLVEGTKKSLKELNRKFNTPMYTRD